ncbi:MAG TPA: prepilin-type N-terminal cleavage/methylation domain-containing protein [Candidatus Saccharicenans sp.]|nr:prepilin-type N-terminal cleavage/methylation domain-containing protein [Candidatus Saccharicenans sp.]HPU93527.1 prepilin-type N-terminal cleavage/methylation domain-containing protein [Candidatus Saccharicenans sp.]
MRERRQKEKAKLNKQRDFKILFFGSKKRKNQAGFTLIELIVSSAIMLVVIIGALALYSRSNQISVDQEQYAELQHDVRSAMYLITRDLRMAGVGLPPEFGMYALEGFNNEDQGTEVKPDRLIILGNIDEPLNLKIQNYQGGHGGGAANVALYDGSFELYPYKQTFYENKIVLILPNTASACRQGVIRMITHVTWSQGGTNEKINTSPGPSSGLNPPGGLTADTDCDPDDFDNGLIMFANVKEFWLDTSGHAELNGKALTVGVDGYVGEPGVLYMTDNGIHLPIAQNIENLQFEYNGDLDDDSYLDGFKPWSPVWTVDQITRIRQIRVIIVGRTPNRFASVSGKVPANIHNYRRPNISDSPGSTTDDYHRRFVLETTANVRNLNLNLYNTGQR